MCLDGFSLSLLVNDEPSVPQGMLYLFVALTGVPLALIPRQEFAISTLSPVPFEVLWPQQPIATEAEIPVPDPVV